LDLVTVEDCSKERFAEGIGVKWEKWARGRGADRKKNTYNFKC